MNPPAQFIASAQTLLLRHTARVVWVLILTACALVASTWHHFNAIWDEFEHLGAGMQLLQRDVYSYDVQHPPVARRAMALGPHAAGAQLTDVPGARGGEQAGRALLYGSGHYETYLYLARAGMLPFLALLLWATWAWARYSHGAGTALLATLLLMSTPPVLGHAGFAVLDIPGAAMFTLACLCLLRWFETQAWKFAVLAGVTIGLAIATKLSSLAFIALVTLAWSGCWWLSRRRAGQRTFTARYWAQAGSIALLVVLCASFTYSLEFRYTVTAQQPINAAWDFLVGSSGWAHDAAYFIARHVPLPTGLEQLVLSVQALLQHNRDGHLSYLLGQLSHSGFVHFYVVALGVKTPLPLLLFGVGGLLYLLLQARQRGWSIAAPSIAFVALLGFCSFYSRINIGLRHVLVLYPLLCVAAAAGLTALWQRYRQPVLHAAVTLLIGWQVSLLYSAHPDYLTYFNALAGNHPERILLDSDLDWGQDVKRLRQRLEELQVDSFAFVYVGTLDLAAEGLPGVRWAEPFQPITGWVAASLYARETQWDGEGFAWLRQYTPRERVGKSIDLYYIPEAKR